MLQFCEPCKHSIDTCKQSNNFNSSWKHKRNIQMVKCFFPSAWNCRQKQQNHSWHYEMHEFTQLKIEKHRNKFHHQTTKEQLEYLKNINIKVHCTNKNLVNVFMSMSVALCHVFMNDKVAEKFTLVELLSNSLSYSNVANPNVNIIDDVASLDANVDDNDDEQNWKNERYNLMM